MRELERRALLSATDVAWREHLAAMSDLQPSAMIRAAGGTPSLPDYQRDAAALYAGMTDQIQRTAVSQIFTPRSSCGPSAADGRAVQFTEVSAVEVRSAVITLVAPDKPQRIVLFPMLRLGSPGFYADVTARLGHCGVVLAEGISGGSLITRALTISYRLPGRRARLGLVRQRIDYSSLEAQVITPDMTGRQLRAGWRAVPWLQRAALLILAPLVGAVFWLLGNEADDGALCGR